MRRCFAIFGLARRTDVDRVKFSLRSLGTARNELRQAEADHFALLETIRMGDVA